MDYRVTTGDKYRIPECYLKGKAGKGNHTEVSKRPGVTTEVFRAAVKFPANELVLR